MLDVIHRENINITIDLLVDSKTSRLSFSVNDCRVKRKFQKFLSMNVISIRNNNNNNNTSLTLE